MQLPNSFIRLLIVSLSGLLMATGFSKGQEPLTFRQKTAFDREVILESMYSAKEWQEAQHEGPVPTNWLTGTLYTGVFACFEATGKTEFLDAAREWCIAADWRCGETRPLHADDICSSQTFLDVYSHDKDPSQIGPIKDLIDQYYVGAGVIDRKLMGHSIWKEASRPFTGRNLWWWCDALYMAPPVLARLGTHTGDSKYFDLLHKYYWDAKAFLFDPEEHLFYRDQGAFPEKTGNGKKLFWGRGNGWVVGGLVRTLDYLPDSDPMKKQYLQLFQEMMLTIAKYQKEDGLWSASLNDPKWLPEPETSASSFFTFALAAGINRGWLDSKVYLPVLIKGWEGLLGCLREDGKLEWAQLVDYAPRTVRHEDHKNYAQGAFLLAASEIYKLNLTPKKYQESIGDKRIITFSKEGAWTWYNDERVVFWNDYLVLGNVNNQGESSVTQYLLPGKSSGDRLKSFPLSTWKEKDDHNNPALLPLSKDRLLAVYARHGTKSEFNSRIISGRFQIGPEDTVAREARVTYSNLYRLEAENGRVYNFFRGKGWNPNMVTSDDQGATWSDALELFRSGDNSTRPYVKYASDNQERIDLFYTDGHPRDEAENNVYHVFYQKGNLFKSNGKKIRSLEAIKSDPLSPKEGTMIFDGSGTDGRGWVHDFERGENGELAGVFISSPDGDEGLDLRYRYAWFNPGKKRWNNYEMAFAGPHLYVPENHYAGGICIDPADINVVYLSSSLNPSTGKPNGTGKFQIFKGITADHGQTWTFEQLTFDLKHDNLRPVVPRNRPEDIEECVVWFRGDYQTYTDYNCEIVGFISGIK